MKKTQVEAIMLYEADELNQRQDIELIAYLVKNNIIQKLQGHYNRVVNMYINSEILDKKGNILREGTGDEEGLIIIEKQ